MIKNMGWRMRSWVQYSQVYELYFPVKKEMLTRRVLKRKSLRECHEQYSRHHQANQPRLLMLQVSLQPLKQKKK